MIADKLNVNLHVFTRIRDKDQQQKHHQQLVGLLYEKGNQTYLRYEEELEGIGKVQNTLKIEEQKVKVIRHGAVTMNHVYQLDKTTHGLYHSPLGPLEMETKTRQLQYVPIQEGASVGKFLLSYELRLNGENAEGFTLEIGLKLWKGYEGLGKVFTIKIKIYIKRSKECAAHKIVKESGTIICAGECSDGFPYRGNE
jgi:uncharacterized beta-barrel protein YwiB (DUF1934 family)